MLQVRALRKRFGSVQAVDGLDLDLGKGEVLALLGPNGAGKSTTVRCLVGLETPDEGSIQIDGHEASKAGGGEALQARRVTGYVPELARLHEALTPAEYLALKGRLFDLGEDVIQERVDALLRSFGLEGRRDSALGELSKGNAQRIALAASLLPGPRLWVLDEPLSGLDVDTAMLVKELVRGFAERGGSVLYCSHLLDVVEAVADSVAVLAEGKIVGRGTLEELRQGAGSGDGARLDEVFRKLTRSSDPGLRATEILDILAGSGSGTQDASRS